MSRTARRDWAVYAVNHTLVGCADRQGAEEFATAGPHLTVVSRVPGGAWKPVTDPGVSGLDRLTDAQLGALMAEASRVLGVRQARRNGRASAIG